MFFENLEPGSRESFVVPIRHEDHYVVRATWKDGSTVFDNTGYVTHGIATTETIQVRRTGLTTGRSVWDCSGIYGGSGR